jgi:hypothetical protein
MQYQPLSLGWLHGANHHFSFAAVSPHASRSVIAYGSVAASSGFLASVVHDLASTSAAGSTLIQVAVSPLTGRTGDWCRTPGTSPLVRAGEVA